MYNGNPNYNNQGPNDSGSSFNNGQGYNQNQNSQHQPNQGGNNNQNNDQGYQQQFSQTTNNPFNNQNNGQGYQQEFSQGSNKGQDYQQQQYQNPSPNFSGGFTPALQGYQNNDGRNQLSSTQPNQVYPAQSNYGNNNQSYPTNFNQSIETPPQYQQVYGNQSNLGGFYQPEHKKKDSDSSSDSDSDNNHKRLKKQANLKWVKCKKGDIPNNAIKGGYEGNNILYVGRVKHKGSLIPGKVSASFKGILVPYDGDEHYYKEYEILTGDEQKLKWKECFGKLNMAGWKGVKAGYEKDGTKLFVGKTFIDGCEIIGKAGTHFQTGLVFSYQSNEYSVADGDKYFILTLANVN